ncbi:branched-chain amino acid ABC transporter permease [Halorubrum sp. 48-1-W]|uniref:branched-chain amino acid ABC transporter permease n=1 Tax=Halorubrum sp. 48-1-W TaxID=2249761 RepID=UPI000DCBEC2E|nr:branched-chain amino acid ABC transporter permease [Halorubrum sp. 48-1-W]RAW47136.1 branched-chain amino acid ABC transporter permease [Halorubrum sp. 48-1-W]
MSGPVPSLDRLPGDPRYWYAGLAVLLVAWPLLFGAFWARIGLGALMWIGLAQSWNMIGGYAGYLDFGHGAYFGIGAFAAGIAMAQFGYPFLVGFGLAIVVSSIVSYLVAVPTLRLTGAYFAIATWAFAESIKQTALVTGITGGTFGLSLPRSPDTFVGVPVPFAISETFFYYAMLVLCLATMALTYYLFERHEFGYRVKALRDDQDAAESLGIDTTRVKRQVYVLSCVVAAVFGSVHAWYIVYIHPNDVLAPIITDRMVIMALLGGLGTLTGPVAGGLLVFLLERLSSVFLGSTTFYLPLIGVLIMVTVLFAPSGIIGILRGEVDRDDVRKNVKELGEKFDLL